jgi:parallel beta-helix repeat protein
VHRFLGQFRLSPREYLRKIGERVLGTLEKICAASNKSESLLRAIPPAPPARILARTTGSTALESATPLSPRLRKISAAVINWSGIAFLGNSAGTARENTCENNGQNGIAWPSPLSLRLRKISAAVINGQVSLFWAIPPAPPARILARTTGYHGIAVVDSAQPTLEKNMCRSNKLAGIAFLGNSAGTARENTCESNAEDGMYVTDSAAPTLSQNICRGNTNEGIHVAGKARPTIEGNQCLGNGRNGIAYRSAGASGVVRNNVCNGNGYNGIGIYAGNPQLEGNTCQNNGWYAIYRQ